MNTPSAIIIRKLQNGNPAVFLLNSVDFIKNTVDMWDTTSAQPVNVPLYVYAASSKPRDEEVDKYAAMYAQKFAPQGGIQIRSRIAKDLSKAYAQQANKPNENMQTKPQETPESPLVASPENKAQQRRESSVEEMLKPRLTLEEWEKRVLVERLIDAASKAFASSLSAIMKESLKA